MKPKRIILLRHGESEGNSDHSIYEHTPDHALALTDCGWRQAVSAGHALGAIVGDESLHYYVSPYKRTRQTLEGIQTVLSGNSHRVFEEPRIREQDWGHLRTPDEASAIRAERMAFGRFFYRFPDGESGADVYDRVSTFLETLHRDFDSMGYADNTILVTHGLTLRLFLMRWFHWTVEYFESLHNPANCDFVVMERNERGRYEILEEHGWTTCIGAC